MNDPAASGFALELLIWITLIPLLIVMLGGSRHHHDDQPPPSDEKPSERRD